MASETVAPEESASRLEQRFGWVDGSLIGLILGSVAVDPAEPALARGGGLRFGSGFARIGHLLTSEGG